MIFHIHHRTEPLELERRPAAVRERDLPVGFFIGFPAAGRAVVDRKPSHRSYTFRIASGEPVDDVDVMRAFLEQQSGAVLLFRTPVAEIAAAVTDEMAAPDGLDLADRAGVDDLLHLEDEIHVAHIMSDHELAAGAVSGFQNMVASFDGNRHGFFQIDRLAGFERGDCHLFVILVADGNENRLNLGIFYQVLIIGINFDLGEFGISLPENFDHFRIMVADRDQFAFLPGKTGKNEICPELGIDTDHTELDFHDAGSFFWFS